MIHYRVQTEEALNTKIYRSFENATNFAKEQNGKVIAYADKQSATNNQNAFFNTESEPSKITGELIQTFVQDSNVEYIYIMHYFEMDSSILLTYNEEGEAVNAQVWFNISDNSKRSKAPFVLNH